jgi:hypothetical protein
MRRYGFDDDAQVVLHQRQRRLLQHALSLKAHESANPLPRRSAHDSLRATLCPNAIQRAWLARGCAN